MEQLTLLRSFYLYKRPGMTVLAEDSLNETMALKSESQGAYAIPDVV
jgi:hypothetical protein